MKIIPNPIARDSHEVDKGSTINHLAGGAWSELKQNKCSEHL